MNNLQNLNIENINSNEDDGIVSNKSLYVSFTDVSCNGWSVSAAAWNEFMTNDKKFSTMRWMFCEGYPYS